MRNFLFLALALLSGSVASAQPQAVHRPVKLMGSGFELTAIHEDEGVANAAIDAGIAEIRRIERLISSWDENSQTSAINRNAGIQPVAVDEELFQLIQRSLKVSGITDGAFDISFAAIEKLYLFNGSETTLPPPEEVARSVAKINYRNIILDPKKHTVFLREEGMRIGFGAIGKGYAANRAKAVMQAMGIANGLVNASGDLTCWGKQEDGREWGIAIADPDDKMKAIAWLPVGEGAVVTSGDYEKYLMVDGRRYAHIIDPRTGYPTTGIKSVTIVCPDAELADALATSVFVLGKDNGLALINQLRGIECLIVTEENELVGSKNLELQYEEIMERRKE
ncbi:MAG: FAD:protein FMN transferase [Phaeodactylibacter sp.]|nr:FAD:protein FMN transferase [Phaeodactylibacter sp.]MCB9296784.1 FAD:protein FMN transferase [Lewinellaceae bacterium]